MESFGESEVPLTPSPCIPSFPLHCTWVLRGDSVKVQAIAVAADRPIIVVAAPQLVALTQIKDLVDDRIRG